MLRNNDKPVESRAASAFAGRRIIFILGLAVTFWSVFALLLLAVRAVWFHRRVLEDEARLEALFGAQYNAYRARVKRWTPI